MITMEKPNVNPAGRYSIKQTHTALGISRSTLQQWEKKGYINSHLHKAGFRRFYTGLDIIKCWNMIA